MTLTMRAGLAALAFGIATGAQAQSTAETYLQEFLQLYVEQGMEMSYGNKTETGNGIELSDITVNLGNAQSSGTITFDSMSFTEIDDPVYEVEVRTSPEFTGTITADSGNGDMTMDMTGTVAGSLRIGGPADDRLMQMDYQAFNLTYDISQLDAQGGTGTIEMSASDIGGTMGYSLSLATQVFDMTAGAMSFGMNMSPPEGGNLDMQMTYTDITASGTAPITNMQDPAAMFSTDGDISFRLESGPYTSTSNFDTPDGAFGLVSNGATSFLAFEGGRGQLDYSVGGTGTKIIVTPQGVPMPPVEADIADLDMRFALPIAPTGGEGTAAIRINLDGVTVSDMLWSMVDPGGAIPRDPAKILIDIEGDADVSANLMDPENAAAMMGNPFRFENATLKALEVSFGGAAVTGSGEATINNAGPIPMPVGGIDLRIAGVNGLLEKLSAIGLVPAEQAMPVRMMLGMFAQPTDEADVFTTRIEAGADGSITANGIPLQ